MKEYIKYKSINGTYDALVIKRTKCTITIKSNFLGKQVARLRKDGKYWMSDYYWIIK